MRLTPNALRLDRSTSLITMQNLVVVSHTVCAHVRGPKIGDSRTAPHLDGGMVDQLVTHYCPISGRRSRSNGLGIGWVPENFGALKPRPFGCVAWLTP